MNFIFRFWGRRSRAKRTPIVLPKESGEDPTCWRIASDVSTSLHEGGMVVLQERAGHIFTCNSIGAEIWQLLASGLSPEHLQSLAQSHGRPLDEFKEEAFRFIGQLEKNGLIVPGDKP